MKLLANKTMRNLLNLVLLQKIKFYIITDAKVVMGSLENFSIISSVKKKKMISNARVIVGHSLNTVKSKVTLPLP